MALMLETKPPELVIRTMAPKKVPRKERSNVCDVVWACVLNDYLETEESALEVSLSEDDDDNNSISTEDLLRVTRKKMKKMKKREKEKAKEKKKKKLSVARTLLESIPDVDPSDILSVKDELVCSGSQSIEYVRSKGRYEVRTDDQVDWAEKKQKDTTEIIQAPRSKNYIFQTSSLESRQEQQAQLGQSDVDPQSLHVRPGQSLSISKTLSQESTISSRDQPVVDQREQHSQQKGRDRHVKGLLPRSPASSISTRDLKRDSVLKEEMVVPDSRQRQSQKPVNKESVTVPTMFNHEAERGRMTPNNGSGHNPMEVTPVEDSHGRSELLSGKPPKPDNVKLSAEQTKQRRDNIHASLASDGAAPQGSKSEQVRTTPRSRRDVPDVAQTLPKRRSKMTESRNEEEDDGDEMVWALEDSKRSTLDEIRQKKLDRKEALERIRAIKARVSKISQSYQMDP